MSGNGAQSPGPWAGQERGVGQSEEGALFIQKLEIRKEVWNRTEVKEEWNRNIFPQTLLNQEFM